MRVAIVDTGVIDDGDIGRGPGDGQRGRAVGILVVIIHGRRPGHHPTVRHVGGGHRIGGEFDPTDPRDGHARGMRVAVVDTGVIDDGDGSRGRGDAGRGGSHGGQAVIAGVSSGQRRPAEGDGFVSPGVLIVERGGAAGQRDIVTQFDIVRRPDVDRGGGAGIVDLAIGGERTSDRPGGDGERVADPQRQDVVAVGSEVSQRVGVGATGHGFAGSTAEVSTGDGARRSVGVHQSRHGVGEGGIRRTVNL